jgi:hypothetical protein
VTSISDIVGQLEAAMGAYIEVKSIVRVANETVKQDKGCDRVATQDRIKGTQMYGRELAAICTHSVVLEVRDW